LRAKIAASTSTAPPQHKARMDIERINLIGYRLADLSARTVALRGYL
jgi:hypothetical protein